MRALVAAVILGGTFGTATATVESIDDEVMVVEIEVEVLDSAESVVAHLSFEREPVLTLPLLDREDGTFGIRTELEPKNYLVIFETVGEGAESSQPVSLAQMGALLGASGGGPTTTLADDDLSEDSERMLWLAVALGAASLSLIAFWVLGSRRDKTSDNDEEAAGADTSAAGEDISSAEEE